MKKSSAKRGNSLTGPKIMTLDTIDQQKEYVSSQKTGSKGLGVVLVDAFLRGMRDLGYKDPAWAMAEMIDNSIQAGATAISIRLGSDSSASGGQPASIAILDNGIGMIPEMISYAVRWGGTDRWDDRSGFGRYGYGLPSSAIYLAKKYAVFSRISGGRWHCVNVDLEKIASFASSQEKIDQLLTPRPASLPEWILCEETRMPVPELKSGTVIVLEELDRRIRGWIRADAIVSKLRKQLGVIYRHFLPGYSLFVQGEQVQAVDPLFLMEHARFYDETPVRAQRVEARTFEVETDKGVGKVTIKASVLPPNFQLDNPDEYGMRGAAQNSRAKIMREYTGIMVCRASRQIDNVWPDWTKYQNFDANIRIEINFDPELDEFFGMTTSKQQIVIDEDMWNRLRGSGAGGGGLANLVDDLRKRFREMRADLKAASKTENPQERKSVKALQLSSRLKSGVVEPTPEQAAEAERNLVDAAKEEARSTGRPLVKVLEEWRDKTSSLPWDIVLLSMPEGPFYRPSRLGEQRRLIINTEHPFYYHIWEAAGVNRVALELWLLVLSECELESRGELETIYRAERMRWSGRLRWALQELSTDHEDVDENELAG